MHCKVRWHSESERLSYCEEAWIACTGRDVRLGERHVTRKQHTKEAWPIIAMSKESRPALSSGRSLLESTMEAILNGKGGRPTRRMSQSTSEGASPPHLLAVEWIKDKMIVLYV